MARVTSWEKIEVERLRPYANNAKVHTAEQIEKLKASIQEFGFISPCLIDRDYNIIAGHGRVMAAKELGMAEVPCIFIEGLTDEQRRAYILADNKLSELGEWDMSLVDLEIGELADADFDIDLTGFQTNGLADWFEDHERNDTTRQEGNEEYNDFLDKFETKKTTDDCYTPDEVFEAVAKWVTEKYGFKRSQIIRPFYPGGDYQKEAYPPGCIVLDNPPFSILSKIRTWFNEHGVQYFLFAPAVSAIGGSSNNDCVVAACAAVTYENGANVHTAFVTNLEPNYVIVTEPELSKTVQEAADNYAKGLSKSVPKYEYPYCVLTTSAASKLSKYGQNLRIRKSEAVLIRALDMQKEFGKTIYGGGYLLSERAAAERAAAERAAAERAAAERAAATVWTLSEREIELQKTLDQGEV